MHPGRSWLGGGLLTLMLLAPQLGLTQQTNEVPQQRYETLQKDIEALKTGQKAILNELQEMKKLLSSPPRGDDRSPIRDLSATLNVADAFVIGEKQAQLTLVEFTDYQ